MKNLLLSLCLILGTICVFNADSHAGMVSFGEYQKAFGECQGALERVRQAVDDVMTKGTGFNNLEKKKNTEVKRSGKPSAWSKKERKKLSKVFKSPHLTFNKKIKEYQTDCKKVEKMIKDGVIYGRD